MGDKKVNLELEWPSFQNNDDNRITYSPDSEAEDIFTNFKPATETHIRNKKRKPRKQKPKSLRLISGKSFLAPLAVSQRAYVMACVRPSVNFFYKHLLL